MQTNYPTTMLRCRPSAAMMASSSSTKRCHVPWRIIAVHNDNTTHQHRRSRHQLPPSRRYHRRRDHSILAATSSHPSRWRSDGAGGDDDDDDAGEIGERRKRDHAHCVEIVRTRDYEGYREFFVADNLFPSPRMIDTHGTGMNITHIPKTKNYSSSDIPSTKREKKKNEKKL